MAALPRMRRRSRHRHAITPRSRAAGYRQWTIAPAARLSAAYRRTITRTIETARCRRRASRLSGLRNTDLLQLRPDVLGKRHALPGRGVEADFNRLLRSAMRHRVGFVEPHLVAEALRANARDRTLDEHELAGADLVVEIDR